jgi:UDP-N-acetylmuramoyl-L-alanyl-D-glutamate--2,6-diaminopimelate ligase
MRLQTLIRQWNPDLLRGLTSDPEVTSIEEDSRKVVPGALFIARPGKTTSGEKFLADAAAKGAVAAIVTAPAPSCPLPQIVCPDPSAAISPLAHVLGGSPSHHLKVFGVTGTNGKTTTTYLIRHLLNKLAHPCGMIGTVEIDDGKTRRESDMTTPAAADVARLLADMRSNACHAASMEVSSHSLHQHRVSAVRFAAAGFTNLTGDHLDYHGTMDAYAGSKALLFESLAPDAVAVVNADSPWHTRMVRDCKARIVRYSFQPGADYAISAMEISAKGTSFTLASPRGSTRVRLALVGRHNIENAVTALAMVAETYGLPLGEVAPHLADTAGAPGRLQAVDAGQPFAVLVDYAHTDDALQNVLSALKPLTKGKLRVVFGCGGDRDKTKRPRMAKVAESLADALYITSDNPRTEDPHAILRDISAGLSQPHAKPTFIDADRRTAIERATRDASAGGGGDVVLIAGKGHENYQILGTVKHHFDDVEEARRVLGSLY